MELSYLNNYTFDYGSFDEIYTDSFSILSGYRIRGIEDRNKHSLISRELILDLDPTQLEILIYKQCYKDLIHKLTLKLKEIVNENRNT